MADGEKPPILQDQEFTVREGVLYRVLRTGAIWMNKLFFSSLVLLGVWLLLSYTRGVEGCADGTCSVFLTPTAKYLGAMAVVSFVLSIVSGLLGLVVGKSILAVAKADEELGARRDG